MLAPMKNEQWSPPKPETDPFTALFAAVAINAAVSGCSDTSVGNITHFMTELLKTKNHHFNRAGSVWVGFIHYYS